MPQPTRTGESHVSRSQQRTNHPQPPPAQQPVARPETTRPSQPRVPDYYSNANHAVTTPPPNLAYQSPARQRVRKRRSRHYNGGEWAWVIIAGALMSVVLVVSLSITLLLSAQNSAASAPTSLAGLPTPVLAQGGIATYGSDIQPGDQITLDDGRSIILQPWNGGSRLTILVMGLDRRPDETGLQYRSDSMMLVSLDRDTNSMGILSIPRDLYVDVPGYSELQRINSAMVLGELEQPNYGPTLAMQTVQYNLGMYVHGYVVVDFEAVTGIIDLLGGVDIDVPYPIADYEYPDMNYGYDPLILSAGLQHMDGNTALRFARTRHGDNDFERARRQQMVIYAVRDRILDTNMLPQLIIQSPTLLSSLSENVYTNLTVDQIIQVAMTLNGMSENNIRTGVIDDMYIMPYTTPQGAQVLVPRRALLSTLLIDVFGADYTE